MKTRVVLALAALPLVLAGCGSSSGSDDATHAMADGSTMSGAAMAGDEGSAAAPSETASMVCGDEIREAVGHTLRLPQAPHGLSSWSDRLFRCRYLVGAGELRLSVKDLDTAGPGRAYFDSLRHSLVGTTPVKGLENFGFPAFESPHGDVVFLKDDKTLWVDASRLAPARLPSGMSREDVAYGVAAAVIGCWTE